MTSRRMLCLVATLLCACVEAEEGDDDFRSGLQDLPLLPGLLPPTLPTDPPQPPASPCGEPFDPEIDPLGEWCECMGSPTPGPATPLDPLVDYCIDMLLGEIRPDVTMYMYCEEHYGDFVDMIELFRRSCSPLLGGNEG